MDIKLESIYLRHINELLDYIEKCELPKESIHDFYTILGMPLDVKEFLINLAKDRKSYWDEVEEEIDKRSQAGQIPQHFSLHLRGDGTYCLYDDFGTIVANCSLETVRRDDIQVLRSFQELIKSKLPINPGDIIDISITNS